MLQRRILSNGLRLLTYALHQGRIALEVVVLNDLLCLGPDLLGVGWVCQDGWRDIHDHCQDQDTSAGSSGCKPI